MSEGRYTTWLNAVERKALEDYAARRNVTVSFVIKMAVRESLGAENLKRAAIELSNETVVVGN